MRHGQKKMAYVRLYVLRKEEVSNLKHKILLLRIYIFIFLSFSCNRSNNGE